MMSRLEPLNSAVRDRFLKEAAHNIYYSWPVLRIVWAAAIFHGYQQVFVLFKSSYTNDGQADAVLSGVGSVGATRHMRS